ncbi:MAG: T9SS type A sorting domain-containing protein, partial [Calditrichaeota bacterium]|nr:T9SS type A sorting domain-containing protein [Calditrichota bacterium]
DNRWHHIAGTFDNRRMKLYYDGRLVDELDVREAIHYDECPLLIGSNEEFDYGEYQFYGLIDEVRISNYPRVFYHGVEQYTDAQFPQEFAILNVYPNPFNSAARIDFSLPYNGYATLKMMDCNGRVVSNLFEKKLLAGKHRYDLRCIDNPAGLYFIQLQSGADVSVRKVVFLK